MKEKKPVINHGPVAIKRSKVDVVFDTFNVILMSLFLFITLYPLYFVIIASFSDPHAVVRGEVYLYPVGFHFEAYQNVFVENRVWSGFRASTINTVFGTMFSLFLTIPGAYALSKKSLPGRTALSLYMLFPMYFGGGLIPTYLVMKDLNMINTWYTLIIYGASSIYNTIVTRVYFESNVPEELYESARIDGASELKTFFKIALPLVTPIIAVMTLFFAVAKWNEYFNALVYVSKSEYMPLQMVLRSILLYSATALESIDTSSMDADAVAKAARVAYMAEAMKYALIVIASAPLMIAYPFVQKHFVKGMMIGAVKG